MLPEILSPFLRSISSALLWDEMIVDKNSENIKSPNLVFLIPNLQ
jgi:hypothetical protein